MTRIGEGYKLSPSRNYTTLPALTGLAHSSRAKYRYNESLLEITNLAVKIQKSGIQRVFVYLCSSFVKQNSSTYHIIKKYYYICILYDMLSIRYG